MKPIGFITTVIVVALLVITIPPAQAAEKSGNVLTGILNAFKGDNLTDSKIVQGGD